MTVDIDGTELTHRVVLVGLVTLDAGDETPAHAGELRRVCTEELDAVEGDVVGTLTEAEVSRALNELEAESVVAASRDDASVTGKGRPRYDLAVERDQLLAALAEDDRLSDVVDDVAA